MQQTKAFLTGRSQAIRLPKEYRFTNEKIYMNKIDDILMVAEEDKVWGIFEKAVDKFTDDFMEDRGMETKDSRPGL